MTDASDRKPEPIRRRLLVSGQVQGVGFRYTTQRVAARFDVTGFVKNLPDGRVELVAEGTGAELDRFVEAVRDAMAGHIQRVESSESDASAEFADFGIAF
jgi:acylphosphatase